MHRFRADWILPISSPPLRDTWVGIDGDRIVAVGRPHDRHVDAVELGHVAILPGLVNAHTHLELSYLRQQVPPAASFTSWIRDIMRLRRENPDAADSTIVTEAQRGIAEAHHAGTALVGDISNTLVTAPLLARSGLAALLFYELLGFNEVDPIGKVRQAREQLDALPKSAHLRTSLAAHAPYSVSPGLFGAIRSDLDGRAIRTSSVHLGESPEETELLRNGTGPWHAMLKEIGVWTEQWRVPRQTSVEYLEAIGFLADEVLVVHGVQCSPSDLDRVRTKGATIVTCPRSNRHVGVGSPPIDRFYASGVKVAFGTDSLASVEDLNIFGELAEAHRLAPTVSPRTLLESATLVGAHALGFGEFGSIEPSKRAALIAVTLPEPVQDVEEHLVSGISPERIRWVQ